MKVQGSNVIDFVEFLHRRINAYDADLWPVHKTQTCPCGWLVHDANECYCRIVDRMITLWWRTTHAPLHKRLWLALRPPSAAQVFAEYQALKATPPARPAKRA
jgi:hypothetical protein